MKSFLALVAAAMLMPAAALHAAERIVIQVGYSPGGSYDTTARLVADHLGKHLSGNPEIIVENVPGAGSLKLAKLVAQGLGAGGDLRIATVSSALALRPIFKPESDDFDPRGVHYLASMANSASYCVSLRGSSITSLRQFLDDPEAKAGATGKGSSTYIFAAAIKTAAGGKYQIVTGFKGGSEIILAMERGDIDVRCGMSSTSIAAGGGVERFNVIAEIAPEPRHEFEGVDFALDLARPEDREALALVFASTTMHLPYIAGPDVPADKVAELRAAFAALADDPAFQADVKKSGMKLNVTPGEKVEEMIARYLAAPTEVQERARELVR